MASDTNVAYHTGRITADPEIRDLPSGGNVANFSIACSKYKPGQGDGEWEEITNFFDFAAYGRTAEEIRDYFNKGDAVSITSEPRQDRWEAEDGSKRSKVRFSAIKVQRLGSNRPPANGGSSSDDAPF